MSNRTKNTLDADTIRAYAHSGEQIQSELYLLDLRIKVQLHKQQLGQSEQQVNQFKGLIISAEEVDTLLEESPGPEDDVLYHLQDAISQTESYLKARAEISLNEDIFLPLEHLAWAFDLNYFERNCVILCLATELNRKYEKLFGYLQDDITCKYPTVDLALKLLCRIDGERNTALSSFTRNSPLIKYLLKADKDSSNIGTRLSQPLQLHRRIVDFFYHNTAVDPELSYIIKFCHPYANMEPFLLDQDIQQRLRIWWKMVVTDDSDRKPLAVLSGPSGSGKRFQIQHLCQYYECNLFIIDLEQMPLDELRLKQTLHSIIRESLLFSAITCLKGLSSYTDNYEADNQETAAARERWRILLHALDELPGPLFILTEKTPQLAELEQKFNVLTIELGVPDELVRKELFENFSQGYKFEETPDWGQIASKFRFTPGQIKNALLQAHETAYGQASLITLNNLHQACFNQGRHYLARTASRITPHYSWDDIILPPETIELLVNGCNQMKNRYIVYGQWGFAKRLAYGKGFSMLFSGLPGTGKTMAAQVIANELSLELYRIDLAQVVSKYIGETEKNLGKIFQEAEYSNAILFFDEADALFGKRSEVKDAHDRYANIEIAYLLQKIEEYDGISILATNLAKNLDDAFVRRITFIVEFPFPDEEFRKRIWISMFPPQTPLHEDVDFDFLAKRFEISGGNIKNIVLAAAFLAAQSGEVVTMQHILRATKYEYQKIGRVLLREDLGEYYGEI
ncbi:MAG: AAA family ATPase [Syntrophomonadaceae bacterium]